MEQGGLAYKPKNKGYRHSRRMIPNVRGGWTEQKIIRYLNKYGSSSVGSFGISRLITEFDSAEQFADHIYYHGTTNYIPKGLKPSITLSEAQAERIGGGGYGERYWGVSLTKRKKTAEAFSGQSSSVSIYPVILKPDAKVIIREDLEDASDIEDIIVDLYTDGVDAVWIGGGEEELVVVNPAAITLYKDGRDSYNVYGGFKSKQLTKEEIEALYNRAKTVYKKGMKDLSETYNIEDKQERIDRKNEITSSVDKFQFEDGGGVGSSSFKKWFGDSKMIDADGKPLVVYHGSVVDFNKFDKKKLGKATKTSIAKLGFYFTADYNSAKQYVLFSGMMQSGTLTEPKSYYLSLQNPYYMEISEWDEYINWGSLEKQKYKTKGKAQKASLEFKAKLIEKGHDSIVVGDNIEIIAFEPTQIKLADGSNTTFDGNNPDIRFDDGGSVERIIKVRWGQRESTENWALAEIGYWEDQDCSPKLTYAILTRELKKGTWNTYSKPYMEITLEEAKELLNTAKSQLNVGNYGEGYFDGGSDDPLKHFEKTLIGYVNRLEKAINANDIRFDEGGSVNGSAEDIETMEQGGGINLVHVYDEDGSMYGTGELVEVKGNKSIVRFDAETIKEFDSSKVEPVMKNGGGVGSSSFKKWFGDSKVVNEEGEPLIVYHQTQEKFDVFDIQKSYTHSFWFTSNLDNILRGETGATQRPNAEVIVMKVYLSIQNMAGWDEYEKYGVGELVSMGYDGIKLDDDYVVFEPTQIKSATQNNGDYNPNNPKITMERGGATYEDLSLKKPNIINDSKSNRKQSIPEIDIVMTKDKKFAASPKITSSKSAVDVFRLYWDTERINVQELLYVALLNNQNEVIAIYHHSKGSIASTTLDIELISAAAVKALARGVIIAHNHPSGALKFSDADEKITEKLKCALKLFDISVLDSLVITEYNYISMADEGISFEDGGGVQGSLYDSQQLKIEGSPEMTVNMFASSPAEFATGGRFSERSTENWDDVPVAWRNINPIKKVNYELMPDNKGLETILKPFVSDDSLRPPMAGIYFSGTHVAATDAHKLISIPHRVSESEVGIYPTANTIRDSKKDTYLAEAIVDGKIEGKFPNYENVIPTAEVIEGSYEFDVYQLYQYTKAALNYSNKTTHQIKFKVSKDSEIGFNGRLLLGMLKAALQMGNDRLYFHFAGASKAGIFTPNKNYTISDSLIFLLMPVMIHASGDGYGSEDMDFSFSLSAYFDFSKNKIINKDGSVAKFKMNYGEVEMFTKPLLRLIKSSIWKSSVLAILDNVKIKDGTLSLTDLESTIEINNIDLPNGLYREDNNSFMQSEADMDDYPKAAILGGDIVADLTMDAEYLKWAIDTTSSFVGNDDLRPVMMGVSIKKDDSGEVIFAATNAHYLVRIDAEEHISSVMDKSFEIILPHKALKQFLQFADTGHITLKSDGVITVFESALGRLTTRNIDGKYPNYDAVIPRTFINRYTVNLDDLKKCVTSKESAELYKKIKGNGNTSMLSAVYSNEKLEMSVIETNSSEHIESPSHLCSISANHDEGTFITPETIMLLMPMMNDDNAAFFNASPSLTKEVLNNLSGDDINLYALEKGKGYGFFGAEFEYKNKSKKLNVKKKKAVTPIEIDSSKTPLKNNSDDTDELNQLIRALKAQIKQVKSTIEKKELSQLVRGLTEYSDIDSEKSVDVEFDAIKQSKFNTLNVNIETIVNDWGDIQNIKNDNIETIKYFINNPTKLKSECLSYDKKGLADGYHRLIAMKIIGLDKFCYKYEDEYSGD